MKGYVNFVLLVFSYTAQIPIERHYPIAEGDLLKYIARTFLQIKWMLPAKREKK